MAQQLAADTEALRAMQQPVRCREGRLPLLLGWCKQCCWAAWAGASNAAGLCGLVLATLLGCEQQSGLLVLPAPAGPLSTDSSATRRQCSQACGVPEALQALQVRLDTLPREEWDSVEEEAAAARQLADALLRELPPPPAAVDAAGQQQQRAPPASVVDDSTTTGAPPASLQMVAVPPSGEEPCA